MKKLLIATAAATALLAAPAMADDLFVGADESGVGVQVGPFGVGVGPRFDGDGYYRDRYYTNGYYATAPGECRLVRERIVTPSGRVIFRSRRFCD